MPNLRALPTIKPKKAKDSNRESALVVARHGVSLLRARNANAVVVITVNRHEDGAFGIAASYGGLNAMEAAGVVAVALRQLTNPED